MPFFTSQTFQDKMRVFVESEDIAFHSAHTQTLKPSMNTMFLCALSKASLDATSAKKPAATKK